MIPSISVIKTLESRPLILDPTVRMISARFNLDRYNSSLISTCPLIDRGPYSIRSTREIDASSQPNDPRRATSCTLKHCVGL